ncbi:diguanylate cyclase [Marinomonas sp. C2222]|uniref:Diguanylate cyclase n=1 Tax=Marinomonas sargassi TaxID=2984494 RepID=A0ABT2YRA0_9GAMM|nr:diguanylate cyclase [Marinomonas sargassi]MCV2402415.1 diguanylate cyclase [Marinomonas sargassi]
MKLSWILSIVLSIGMISPGLAFASASQASTVYLSGIKEDPISLTKYLSILQDPTQSLSLKEIRQPEYKERFLPANSSSLALNLGLSKSAYWVRVEFSNMGKETLEKLFEISMRQISEVDFYFPDSEGNYQTISTGSSRPFSTRAYKNRNFVFPLLIPEGSKYEVYFRIASQNTMILPALLWSEKAFHDNESLDYSLQVVFFVMAALLMLFNSFVYIALRDISYLVYIGFSFCSVAFVASSGGLAHEFIWPRSGPWNDISQSVFSVLSPAILMLFTCSILKTKEFYPKLHLLLTVSIIAVFFVLVALSILDSPVNLVQMYAAWSFILILVTLVFGMRHKRQSTFLFFLALLVFLIGSSIYIALTRGALPYNAFTSNSVQIGSCLEIMIFALMLGERFNRLVKEKQRDQEALIQAQNESLSVQKRLVNTLHQSEKRLEKAVEQRTSELKGALKANRKVMEYSPLAMLVIEGNGICSAANQAAQVLFYKTRNQLIGLDISKEELWREKGLYTQFLKVLETKKSQAIEVSISNGLSEERFLDVQLLSIELDGTVKVLIQIVDLTKHKQSEKELKELAFYDGLTGLKNRRSLLERLDQAIMDSHHYGHFSALLFIDLNKFKQLNDTHGHDAGDKLLIEVAKRLKKNARQSDVVARLGGDEFIILAEGLGTEKTLASKYSNNMVGKIQEALSDVYSVGNIIHHGSASVGVTLFSGNELDADEILKKADLSMYEVKRQQRG